MSLLLQAKLKEGFALHQQGKFAEAERLYAEVLRLQPKNVDALHFLGLLALQTHQTRRGVELIKKAVAIDPGFAPAHVNLGNGLLTMKRPEEALRSCDRAIALKPDYAAAHNIRGNALISLKRPEEALASFDKAIALRPGYAEAYNGRGKPLNDLKRLEEALASCDQAIALNPGYAEAYNNRGNALQDLGLFEEALASYDKAIALNPGYAEAHKNRAGPLKDLKRFEEALASYNKAIALKPDLAEAGGYSLDIKIHICDWSHFDAERARLISSVRNGDVNQPSFALFAVLSSPDDQLHCAKRWIEDRYPAFEKPVWRGERYDHDRIRVAYLSADFHAHATATLITGLIEQHDRSRFEIAGFSFGIDDRSEMRKRLVASFDSFHDVRSGSDREIAGLLYDRQVDVAIDLKGYSQDSRHGILAYRPAPIQVNYLGYPGTMGAPFIDYIIADRIVIPLDHRKFFAEKIVHLPDCYQVNDAERKIAEGGPARRAAGLPERGFVFCCFNNNWKITPGIFDAWMRLLQKAGDSVLWLLEDNAAAAANLRKEAVARGVAADRLVFAQRVPLPEHLARHRCADLFLDTLPCNAHTTASDALWAGLPVLTCRGETFAGRVAASLLGAIHLPELVTASLEEYEHLATELATNPGKLAGIKRKLAENRLTTPLFDTKSYTRHLEAAYTAMHERHRAGLAPDHIVIPNS